MGKTFNYFLLTVAALFAGVMPLAGAVSDQEATALFDAGHKAYTAGDYYEAGKKFTEAVEKAESPVIKANSLRAQVGAWRMCGLFYREFTAIDKLLSDYPEYTDFAESVNREFEIGEAFFRGRTEPAFWHLRWIPWLTEEDHTAEIFEKALKHAPFAAFAPQARLRLAFLYVESRRREKALEELRTLIRDYPGSDMRKYAMLALADELFILAKRGDGDGRYMTEANEVLARFKKEFPKSSENAWVDIKTMEGKDIQAERLRTMAEFYQKNGRTKAAERYLAQILRDYPDTGIAVESEKLLTEISGDFVPGAFTPDPRSRLPEYRSYKMPEESSRILLTPGENGNHFLIPVPRLKSEPVKVSPQQEKGEAK